LFRPFLFTVIRKYPPTIWLFETERALIPKGPTNNLKKMLALRRQEKMSWFQQPKSKGKENLLVLHPPTFNHCKASGLNHNNKTTMNSGSGIQELMAAETRASQIVAEARIGGFSLCRRRGVEFCALVGAGSKRVQGVSRSLL
jgi:hypothetical protein